MPTRPPPRSLASIALALGLALPCPPVSAALGSGPTESGPKGLEEDAQLMRAKELYTRGKGKFDTADYEAAIELWTEAYTTLPDDPETARTKALLIYNIASAQEQAFRVDRDIAHLRQARILMQNYADAIPLLYGDTQEAVEETNKVEARLASLDEAIEEAEAEVVAAVPEVSEPRVDEPTAVPSEDEGPTGPDPVARGMFGAGVGLVVLGAAGLGTMIAGLVIGDAANDIDDLEPNEIDARRMRFNDGRAGNTMAVVGGVVGGAFSVAGAVLIVLGRRRAARRAASLQPVLGPSMAGLRMQGRF